jgi:hypothetical protein
MLFPVAVFVNSVGLVMSSYYLFVWLKLPVQAVPAREKLTQCIYILVGIALWASLVSLPYLPSSVSPSPSLLSPSLALEEHGEGIEDVVVVAVENAEGELPSNPMLKSLAFMLTLGLVQERSSLATLMGGLATVVCIVMFASPLVQLQMVIQQKNSAYLNFYLSLVTCLNCSAWFG